MAPTGGRSGAGAAPPPDWLEGLLSCPRCHGELRFRPGAVACSSCSAGYPVRFGIPDLRLRDDPFIDRDAEVAKIERVLGPERPSPAAEPPSFRELLRRYYALSPENPPSLHRHYVRAMLAARARGEAHLRKLAERGPERASGPLLDLGCGTAGMTAAAASTGRRAVGVDVALRWLVIGRQRLSEEGLLGEPSAAPVALVCANAEHLPFREGAFSAAVGDSVLEHVRDRVATREQLLRVLRPGAPFFFSVNNRFSVLPEPHVRIWGFGLLPRRWAERVALRVRGTPYKARPPSVWELRRLFRDVGAVEPPYFDREELRLPPAWLRRGWQRVRRLPLLPRLALPWLPLLYVFGRKPEGRGAGP